MALPVSAQRIEIGRTVNRTFSAIGGNFVAFFLLALLLAAVPSVLITFGIGYLVGVLMTQGVLDSSNPILITSLPLAIGVVTMIPTYVLIGALTHGSVVHYRGARAGFGECIATGFRYLLPLIGLGLLTAIGLSLWFLLVFVPGIIIIGMLVSGLVAAGAIDPSVAGLMGSGLAIFAFIPVALAMIRWSVSAPALVVESPGIMGAFKRSVGLTRSNRWKIFFLGLVYFVVSFLIQLAITFVGSSIVGGVDGFYMVGTWVVYGLTVLYSAINTMILASGQAALYYELRTSKEGATSDELARVFE